MNKIIIIVLTFIALSSCNQKNENIENEKTELSESSVAKDSGVIETQFENSDSTEIAKDNATNNSQTALNEKLEINAAENEIQKSLVVFIENIKNKKIKSAVESIYPRFFEFVPKEQMTQLLNFTYNNPALLMEVQKYEIDAIEKPEKINKEYYAITDYSFKMKLKLDWDKIPNSDQFKNQIKTAITTKYGEENIQYNADKDEYTIHSKMKACAISENQKEWTFLILEPELKPQLKNILPEKILDKF